MNMNSKPSTSGHTQEFPVRLVGSKDKKYSVLKFSGVDITKAQKLSMERQNNLREFRAAHNQDSKPKAGAGSEFGREEREEARRKKYGIYMKNYNAEDQPWVLNTEDGKKYHGVKQGGTLDNASYYIFTQHSDGAFEALPISEWYNFTPVNRYKHLNAEEAEEEYNKRDKVLNRFSVMIRKRIKTDAEEPVNDEEKKVKKKEKKDFMLSDLDEWGANQSEEEGDEDKDDDPDAETDTKDKKKPAKGKKKNVKTNEEDEALEESDENNEGIEIDYMSDSESSDDEMPYEDKDRDKEKYEEKGVEQEVAESEEEDQEEEEKNEENENESSSSSNESEENFKSALLLQKPASDGSASRKRRHSGGEGSRSTSPDIKVAKMDSSVKVDSSIKMDSPAKMDSPGASGGQPSQPTDSLSEDIVKRYLTRKPMTTKDLIQKFRHIGLNNQQLVDCIADILKKLSPILTKQKIGDKLYLHIK